MRKSESFLHSMTNNSKFPMRVTGYLCTPRQDIPQVVGGSVQTLTNVFATGWTEGSQDQGGDALMTGAVIGTTVFQNAGFTKKFKIIKTKVIVQPPGTTSEWKLATRRPVVYTMSNILPPIGSATPTIAYYLAKKKTRFWVFEIHGVPVQSSVTITATHTAGYTAVGPPPVPPILMNMTETRRSHYCMFDMQAARTFTTSASTFAAIAAAVPQMYERNVELEA